MEKILPPEFTRHVNPPGMPGNIVLLEFSTPDSSENVCHNCGEIPPGVIPAWLVKSRLGENRENPRMWLAGRWVYGHLVLADCPVCAGSMRREFLERNSGMVGMMLQSGVPATSCNLDSFSKRIGSESALDLSKKILSDVTGQRKIRSAMFIGNYGVGKTHLLCAILNGCRLAGLLSRYTTSEGILSDIRETFSASAKRITQDVIREYSNIPILAIDELPRIQTNSEWVTVNLFEIINKRLSSNVLTIFASNKSLDEMTDEPLSAIASRLRAGLICEIKATDFRPAIGGALKDEVKF